MTGSATTAGRVSYRGIAADLESRIASGEFGPGQMVPPIIALARAYSVAPMTIRRAIKLLCSAGRLRTVPGSGTFVADGCSLKAVVVVTTLTEFQGREDISRVLFDTLGAAQEACSEVGIPVITVTETDDPKQYLGRGYGFLLSLQTRDLHLAGWAHALAAAREPYVTIGMDHGQANYIHWDTAASAEAGLEYLHGLGHRRVDVLSRISGQGTPIIPVAELNGPEDLQVRLHAVCYRADSMLGRARQDFEVLERIFSQPEAPTAIFTGTGASPEHTMQFCHDRGIAVPEQCSVLGFCRRVFAEWGGRRITRVDNPRQTIARRCVHELIKMASGGGYAPGRVLVEPELVIGETCAAPPAEASMEEEQS